MTHLSPYHTSPFPEFTYLSTDNTPNYALTTPDYASPPIYYLSPHP